MTKLYDRGAFLLLVALSVIGVLSLPAFPGQDGPAHSYMAWVFSELLAGNASLSRDFAIRSVAPPYSTLNYLLIVLQRHLTPSAAEQIVVCVYALALAFGFRHLTQTLLGGGNLANLLMFAFLFSTPVFQGFYNFGLGLGLMLWAVGFWVGLDGKPTPVGIGGFVLTVVLLGLTHPAALLLLMGFLALHLCWYVITEYVAGQSRLGALGSLATRRRLQTGLFLASLAPCLYVLQFIGPGDGLAFTVTADTVIRRLSQLKRLIPFTPYDSPATWAVTLLVIATVLVLVAIAAWQQRRTIAADSFWPVVIFGVGAMFVYLVAPGDLVGAHTNLDRRFPPIAILMLTAAAAKARLPRIAEWPARLFAGALVTVTLVGLYLNTVPAANIRAALAEAPALRPGARGIVVATDASFDAGLPRGLRYSPCIWGAGDYFQRSGVALQNLQWLSLPYLPLQYRTQRAYHQSSAPELSEFVSADAGKPIEAMPTEVDVVFAYQCRTGDAALPDGETLTGRFGLAPVWSSYGFAVYARPDLLAAGESGAK